MADKETKLQKMEKIIKLAEKESLNENIICNKSGRPAKGAVRLFTERHVVNITKDLDKKLKASAENNCISVLDQIRLILNKYYNNKSST